MRPFVKVLAAAVVAVALVAVGLVAPVRGPERASALTGVIPPVLGNTSLGTSSAPAAVQAFEAAAIQKVLATHNLPAPDVDAVKAWARDEIAAQEWLDLVAIIQKPAASRTTQEAAVFSWFQGVYQQRRIAEADAAVEEFIRYSGMDRAEMAQAVPPDPIPEVYCAYQPPDGGSGPFASTYSVKDDPNCQPRGCPSVLFGCAITYPGADKFTAWGAYTVQKSTMATPAFTNRALGVAASTAIAASLAATAIAVPLAVSLASGGIPAALQLASIFPYAVRAGSIAAISAGALAFVVGTAIVAAVTIGLEIYRIASNAAVPHTLLDRLKDAQTTAPNLVAEVGTDAGRQNLYTTFLTQTVPDVDYSCTDGTTNTAGVPCFNGPAPVAASTSDPQFGIFENRNGVFSSRIDSSIYSASALEQWDGLRTRMSGNGWFVTDAYDMRKAENAVVPTTPGPSAGSEQLPVTQSLKLAFKDWDGHKWTAQRVRDTQGRDAFAIAPLESSAQGSCASTSLNTTATNCITNRLAYITPDGAKALAMILPASSVLPNVTANVPPVADGGTIQRLSASATTTLGTPPFTYRWVVGSQVYNGATVDVTVPNKAGVNAVSLTVTDAGGRATTQTYSMRVRATTTLAVMAAGGGIAGQPYTLWARVMSSRCPPPPFNLGVDCASPPTGQVQFTVRGLPAGPPVSIDPTLTCPIEVCGLVLLDPNSSWAKVTISDLPPSSTRIIGTDGLQTGSLQGPGWRVSAEYSGDADYTGSTTTGLRNYDGSPWLTGVLVDQAQPTVSLDVPTYPQGTWRTPVTLHAQLQLPTGNVLQPAGKVGFTMDGKSLGAPVSVDTDGNATLTTTLPVVKAGAPTPTFAVQYSGTQSFKPANATTSVAPTTPVFTSVGEIASARSPIAIGFSRSVQGVTKAHVNVVRTDTATTVPVKIVCSDDAGAAVSCTKGPVASAQLVPSSSWIPGLRYQISIGVANSLAPIMGGYLDGIPMAADGVERTAPSTASWNSDWVAYQWGSQKDPAALGGSYRQDRGGKVSFKARGASVGVITWNGPDGGLADITVTASDGAVQERTISTYAPTAGGVLTTFDGLPATGTHVVEIRALGQREDASTDVWVRVDGTVSNGVTAASPALTPARWDNLVGAVAYTDQPGAKATFSFYGTALDLPVLVGPGGGNVKITIDTTVVAPAADLYAPDLNLQSLRFDGLPPAVHKVTIQVLATKNPASVGLVAGFAGYTAS